MKEDLEVLRRLSHPGTVRVLKLLREENVMTFSDLMFKAQLNPSTLNTILKTLVSSGIVRKNGQGYGITSKGQRIAEIIDELVSNL